MNITEAKQFLTESVAQRLSALHTDAKPSWGSMEAQEMVEHLAMAMKGGYSLEFGADKEPKPAQAQAKITFLEEDAPYPHYIPSPFHKNGRPPYLFANLDEAKENLLLQIKLMYEFLALPENQAKFFYHPFLGKLNHEELQKFNTKHFKHHFEQFGI